MFLDEDGDRTSLWEWTELYMKGRGAALVAENQAVVSVVCTQRSQMQLIITKGCLFMESEVTTILESPNFCLNTSSMSHSFCSGYSTEGMVAYSFQQLLAPSASGIKL